jgi:hypothetical protein
VKLLAWVLADGARMVDRECAEEHGLPAEVIGKWCTWRSRRELAEQLGQVDEKRIGAWLDLLNVRLIERRKWLHEAPVLVLTLEMPDRGTRSDPSTEVPDRTPRTSGPRYPIGPDRGTRSDPTEVPDRGPPLYKDDPIINPIIDPIRESARAVADAPPSQLELTHSVPTAGPDPKAAKGPRKATPGIAALVALRAAIEATGGQLLERPGDVKQHLAAVERAVERLRGDVSLADALAASAAAHVQSVSGRIDPSPRRWAEDVQGWATRGSYLPKRGPVLPSGRPSTIEEHLAAATNPGGRLKVRAIHGQ